MPHTDKPPRSQPHLQNDRCENIVTFFNDDQNISSWLFKDAEALDYFAGDVQRIPEELWGNLEKLRDKRGEKIYIDLMLALTHKRFGPEEARTLWKEMLLHKYYLSEKLGRNVGIRVAALDFLENQRGIMHDLRLLPERDLDCLLLFVNEDGLTGLYNHRYFQEQLRHELARARRYKRTLGLLLMDLDRFKDYNDRFGHRQGDRLLKDVAEFFRVSRRESDTVARYGGDEFAIILPETTQREALTLAKRLRNGFEARKFGLEGAAPVTLSIGVASFPSEAGTAEQLIEKADQGLYQAKRAGRNQVSTAETKNNSRG